MAFRGSIISRPLLAAARSASRSSPAPVPRSTRRPPPFCPSSPISRRLSFAPPMSLEALGGTMSLLPLHNVVAAARLRSHLSANARSCCELLQGS